jgi:hypothetical protein
MTEENCHITSGNSKWNCCITWVDAGDKCWFLVLKVVCVCEYMWVCDGSPEYSLRNWNGSRWTFVSCCILNMKVMNSYAASSPQRKAGCLILSLVTRYSATPPQRFISVIDVQECIFCWQSHAYCFLVC